MGGMGQEAGGAGSSGCRNRWKKEKARRDGRYGGWCVRAGVEERRQEEEVVEMKVWGAAGPGESGEAELEEQGRGANQWQRAEW